RFDTSNPPGDEAACVAFIGELLDAAGLETRIVARDPARPNLIARLPGEGRAAPLLLHGHVDVVPAADGEWSHPPFGGTIADDLVWGRGALDMKGGFAMLLCALLRAKAQGATPPGDVVLAVLSDEEAGGDLGARFLVEQHPELFGGIRYAIGEFGGFSLEIGGRRFYPVQVSEKQTCSLRATVRGPGGHGALPLRGGAMARLARLLGRLDRRRLPVHVTPVTRAMIDSIAGALPFPRGHALRLLLNPRLTDRVLDLAGEQARAFDALLHNTVNATVVRGGEAVNVIPGAVAVELDGRLLPGHGPDEMLAELHSLAGPGLELEVLRHEPGPPEPDLGLYGTLAATLREADPDGTPVPMLLPGATDGRHFARLGIQTYGFLPMRLPSEFRFMKLVHAADERVPVDALEFGTAAICKVLRRFDRGA
ncbi:MAG: M20/M25/M40 family metallo-hydrolase, partial [Gaiellales bacterium]